MAGGLVLDEAARAATAGDVPELVALAEAARTELAPTRGGRTFLAREAPEATDIRFRAVLADDRQLAVVGTLDGVVVGYGVARLEELRDGSQLGMLDDLFVLPDGRGVGVGEAMMTPLLTFCRDHGCVGVDAVALPGNRATKNFFETFGLVARSIAVHRSFRDPSEHPPEHPPEPRPQRPPDGP